jgi:uncharacterized protein (DUF2336 family)
LGGRPDDAARGLGDSDWTVRLAALRRAPREAVRPLLEDPEAEVRAAAWQRLAQAEVAAPPANDDSSFF